MSVRFSGNAPILMCGDTLHGSVLSVYLLHQSRNPTLLTGKQRVGEANHWHVFLESVQ